MTDTDLLTITDVSRRSGVASSALRFYESRGLIASERAGSGHRRFTRAVLRRIAFIVFAQKIGLSLEEVGAELEKLPPNRVPERGDWAKLSAGWTRRVEQRIAELERLKEGLTECIGCGCLSLRQCRFANPEDRAGRRGQGPRFWVGGGIVVFILASMLTARPAAAQTAGAWEIEVFAGGAVPAQPSGGTSALPEPGAAFTTSAGTPSRRVSSWYFGDGALLLNQVLQSFGRNERITPLDPLLTTPVLQRQTGGAIGARVRRHLNARTAAEFSLEYGLGRDAITGAGVEAIEASRASFVAAWAALFATGAFSSPTITSVATIGSGGRQLLTSGAINVALKTTGRIRPYVTGGAGILSRLGNPPDVELAGEYRVFFTNVVPIAERDSVKVRYEAPETSLVGLVGGGITYAMSRTWGFHGDVRVHFWRNNQDTLVDATPFIETVTSPTLVLPSPTTPSIQFRNFPLPGAGVGPGQPTFAGPPITGFETFTGNGLQRQMDFTMGVYRRF